MVRKILIKNFLTLDILDKFILLDGKEKKRMEFYPNLKLNDTRNVSKNFQVKKAVRNV